MHGLHVFPLQKVTASTTAFHCILARKLCFMASKQLRIWKPTLKQDFMFWRVWKPLTMVSWFGRNGKLWPTVASWFAFPAQREEHETGADLSLSWQDLIPRTLPQNLKPVGRKNKTPPHSPQHSCVRKTTHTLSNLQINLCGPVYTHGESRGNT